MATIVHKLPSVLRLETGAAAFDALLALIRRERLDMALAPFLEVGQDGEWRLYGALVSEVGEWEVTTRDQAIVSAYAAAIRDSLSDVIVAASIERALRAPRT